MRRFSTFIYAMALVIASSTAVAAKHKTKYVRLNGLGGVMFWELSGDTSDGELISAIHKGLTQRGAR